MCGRSAALNLRQAAYNRAADRLLALLGEPDIRRYRACKPLAERFFARKTGVDAYLNIYLSFKGRVASCSFPSSDVNRCCK